MKVFTAVVRLLMLCMLVALAGPAAAQQAYPNKQCRVIVPYGLGGSTDILARLVSQKLTESWSQQFIVDNRPGGNLLIGSEALVRSAPDGYTLMVMAVDHVIVPHLLSAPYDAIRDFAPVATLASTGYVLVLHPSVAANTLQEFIGLAKSRPGQLNYASAGSGTVPNLAGELFNIQAGVKMQHVPYKGGGPAVNDLVGGHVQLQFATPISVLHHIKSGKLKAIAVTGQTRMSSLPKVPTFAQGGLPDFDVRAWFGVLAPVGTPTEIIDKLSAEIAKIVAVPELKEKLASQGMESLISTPEQFAALMKADTVKFAKVITTANIRLEQ